MRAKSEDEFENDENLAQIMLFNMDNGEATRMLGSLVINFAGNIFNRRSTFSPFFRETNARSTHTEYQFINCSMLEFIFNNIRLPVDDGGHTTPR